MVVQKLYGRISLTQTPLGLISSKIDDYRLILCILTVGSAIALFLFITVDTFYGMLLVSGVLGIFLGGVFTQSTAFVSDLVPLDRKGVTLAIFDAFIDSTFMLAPILTGVLIGFIDLDGTFLTFSFLNLVAFIVIATYLRNYQNSGNDLHLPLQKTD